MKYNPIAKQYEDDILSGKLVAGRLLKLAIKRQRDDLKNAHKRGLYFDHNEGQRWVDFFSILMLGPDQPFELMPFNLWEIYVSYGWHRLEDGTRRFRTKYKSCARKNAKCLAVDTPIPTPEGFKPLADIKEGDFVFDENGIPALVEYVSPVKYNHPCYKVVFSDGSELIADADHLWETETRLSGATKGGSTKTPKLLRHRGWGLFSLHGKLYHVGKDDEHLQAKYEKKLAELLAEQPLNQVDKVKSTEQIRSTLRTNDGEANHSIPVCRPVHFDAVELPVDPYFLGAWLGDGDSETPRITCQNGDIDIIRRIESAGYKAKSIKVNDRTPRYAFELQHNHKKGAILQAFRGLGVINNKHIPAAYLYNSVENRIALLNGLMDTDGSAMKSGQCTFVSKTRRLVDDVKILLQSLGIKVTFSTKESKINGRVVGEHYTLQFFAPKSFPVFGLARKQSRLKENVSRCLSRHIVDIIPVDSVPVKCIKIDRERGLFLAGTSFIATHNTPIASGEILGHLTIEGLHRAEAYVSATKEDQAKIAFDDAKSIISHTPELQEVLESSASAIYNRETESKFQFLTSNPKTADGTRPSYALIDEFHEFESVDMLTKLRTGQIHRKQPIFNIVTTRGSHKDWPCFNYERKTFIPILEGSIKDDSTFVVIYSQDSEEEFDKPETWIKSNPMLCPGGILKLETLIEEQGRAKNLGEEAIVGFKTLNLNWWCDAATQFVPEQFWNASGSRWNEEILHGKNCWAGLDMGATQDFCALALYFPPDDWLDYENAQKEKTPEEEKSLYVRSPLKVPGKHRVIWRFWIPEYKFEARIANGLHQLRDWVKAGHIRLLEGNVIDPREIEKDIEQLSRTYNIRLLTYDRYNATSTALTVQEHCGVPTIEFPQTIGNFSKPTKDYRDLIAKYQLDHGFNPIATWMMRNAVQIKDNNDNIRITKDSRRSAEKVDGVIAAIMALGGWMNYKEEVANVYDIRGFLDL